MLSHTKLTISHCSKMILSEELSATLDEPTDCVMMHRVEPSRLQLLALNLADKLQGLQENNEQVRRGRERERGKKEELPCLFS